MNIYIFDLYLYIQITKYKFPGCVFVFVTRSNAYSGQSNVCTQRDAQAHDHDQRTTLTH